ncbi:MAG: metallophosphoesterase, partial [Candidatus Kariarchaeaceae archaeon]
CVVGFQSKGKIIANEVLFPDIPTLRKRRRAPIPVHVAFLSDLHIGSRNFLSEPFDRFIEFLNGNFGNRKMKALGNQTKYVLVCGDAVDGIGIYPNQNSELLLQSYSDQYDEFTGFVERIPEDVELIMIPGNHDMVRPAEPQPRILAEHVPSLDKMQNVHLLSNPSQISLHSVEVLMYHCTSIFDIMNHVPGLPIDKPIEAMKHMLKTRHLAPIWGAKTPIAAENHDYLTIDRVPDILHGGHVHINGVGVYRGVQIVNSGTMQAQTDYQKSLNIVPTPGQVSLLNLRTFDWNSINLLSA